MCMYEYIYIYIYIERERDVFTRVCVYIYIYIYIYREREREILSLLPVMSTVNPQSKNLDFGGFGSSWISEGPTQADSSRRMEQ